MSWPVPVANYDPATEWDGVPPFGPEAPMLDDVTPDTDNLTTIIVSYEDA